MIIKIIDEVGYYVFYGKGRRVVLLPIFIILCLKLFCYVYEIPIPYFSKGSYFYELRKKATIVTVIKSEIKYTIINENIIEFEVPSKIPNFFNSSHLQGRVFQNGRLIKNYTYTANPYQKDKTLIVTIEFYKPQAGEIKFNLDIHIGYWVYLISDSVNIKDIKK